MLKNKIFIIYLLIILNFSSFLLNLFGESYSLGVREGEQYFWRLTCLDEEEMKKTFGKRGPPFLNLNGDRLEDYQDLTLEILQITEVEENGFKYWSINYKLTWSDFYSNSEDLNFNVFNLINQNPSVGDYTFRSFFSLTPVEDYFSRVFEGDDNYIVNDNTVIYQIPYFDVKIELTYDINTGVLFEYLIYKSEEIIYGISQPVQMTHPILVISYYLLLIVIPTSCLVIFLIRNRAKKKTLGP